jgi:hypothetical protein
MFAHERTDGNQRIPGLRRHCLHGAIARTVEHARGPDAAAGIRY